MNRSGVLPELIAGRYQVLSRLSAGGMGEVYRAKDVVLGRIVAIKVLPPEFAQDESFVERFRHEAQAAARLSHTNVVHVYDWGEWESTYFMVMEYVRGKNLRELLAVHKFFAPQQAVEICDQMAAGLEAAHSQGLVHRDIKPENVLVSADGIAKVADFGIARLAQTSETTSSLFGTIAYAAPEQIRNQPADVRTDVYSIGCVLYEMLTGAPPFEGDAASIIHMHLSEPAPPPSRERREVTDELDDLIVRATDPEPNKRFQNVSQLRTELRSALFGLDAAPPVSELAAELTTEVNADFVQTVAAQPKKKRNLRWLLPVGLVLVALAIIGFYFWPVRVPAVLGMDQGEAVAALTRAGFDTQIERVYSDDPPGSVLSSDPRQDGWARRGRAVLLTVSRGPQVAQLPNLVGLPIDVAKKRIEETGLILGKVESRHDPQVTGTVIEQDQAPGAHRAGTPVNLVISSGPEFVEVPSVISQLFADAVQTLSSRELEAVREDVFSDQPADTVLEQNPSEGARVEKGSKVFLKVSKGPEPFQMPDVRRKRCADARSQLESLGLVVVVTSRDGSGKCGTNLVDEQDPFPGATVKKGQEVNLYVA